MENEYSANTYLAPYVSFVTFQSGVQALRDHGLPPEIDRSAWSSRSGIDQTLLLSAFKFLGLIDAAGKTQQALEELVVAGQNTDAEKRLLDAILRRCYPKLFDLDLTAATPNQLSDAVGSYGRTGATKSRAVRFFVKSAEHCGIEMSGRLTKQLRAHSGTTTSDQANGTAKTSKRRGKRKIQRVPQEESDGVRQGDAFKTVELPNTGGTLTLTGTFNLFALAGRERALVFEVIDKMTELENETKKETP